MEFKNNTDHDIIHKASQTTIAHGETIQLPRRIGLILGLTEI